MSPTLKSKHAKYWLLTSNTIECEEHKPGLYTHTNNGYLLASIVQWRTFNIHERFFREPKTDHFKEYMKHACITSGFTSGHWGNQSYWLTLSSEARHKKGSETTPCACFLPAHTNINGQFTDFVCDQTIPTQHPCISVLKRRTLHFRGFNKTMDFLSLAKAWQDNFPFLKMTTPWGNAARNRIPSSLSHCDELLLIKPQCMVLYRRILQNIVFLHTHHLHFFETARLMWLNSLGKSLRDYIPG